MSPSPAKQWIFFKCPQAPSGSNHSTWYLTSRKPQSSGWGQENCGFSMLIQYLGASLQMLFRLFCSKDFRNILHYFKMNNQWHNTVDSQAHKWWAVSHSLHTDTVVALRHCTALHGCKLYIQQRSPEHPRGLLTQSTEGLERLGCVTHPFLPFLEHFCSQWMWEQESKHMHEVAFSHPLKFKLVPILCLGNYHSLKQSPWSFFESPFFLWS